LLCITAQNIFPSRNRFMLWRITVKIGLGCGGSLIQIAILDI